VNSAGEKNIFFIRKESTIRKGAKEKTFCGPFNPTFKREDLKRGGK